MSEEKSDQPWVVPRARRPGSAARLPLAELIAPLEKGAMRGTVLLVAPAGGGKSTALAYLRGVFSVGSRVGFFDEDHVAEARAAALGGVAVLAVAESHEKFKALEIFELCPWTMDDCVEYLVAGHREQCASVLERLNAGLGTGALEGSPQVLATVLEAMAGDSSLAGAREACRRKLGAVITGKAVRDRLMEKADLPAEQLEELLNAEQRRWWRHAGVRRILWAHWIAVRLGKGLIPGLLRQIPDWELVGEIGEVSRGEAAAIRSIERLVLAEPQGAFARIGASILVIAKPDWKPPNVWKMNLCGAKLGKASWAGVDLASADMAGVDLAGADLKGAKLREASAAWADLSGANLGGAAIGGATLHYANLSGADLSGADGQGTEFWRANLTGANLRAAIVCEAGFNSANMENTIAIGADFSRATLTAITCAGADFSEADFNSARFAQVDMREANWRGASFAGAWLNHCNLEGLDLPGADFRGADLSGSLFTGSRMGAGNFRGANLRGAGLADVEWEQADLREADFTEASFHLGSTRSGLVGSLIPGEGSRTGFYTDEFGEQNFKAAEEIRKANLRGAKLAGAKVMETDWYLVDLREAEYTEGQKEHFVRCGAILG